MFWADQNHLLPLPKVAEENIPLVYQVNNVCIISKKSNRMKRSINNKTPNKGRRPTKKLSEKRKYRITVKMATEGYYAMKLKAKNAGVSASEIVRMAIRDCHIKARLTAEQARLKEQAAKEQESKAKSIKAKQEQPKDNPNKKSKP